MSLLWINGVLTDKAAARVSPFDHGFLYGDGVWEPLRVFAGRPFRPADHARQLFAAAAALGIDIPLSQPELIAAVEATIRANDRTAGYVRAIVTRGPGTIGPDPRKLDPQVIVTAEEYLPFPPVLAGHGLHVVAAPVRVDSANPAHAVRALGQPHVALAKRHALRHGCLDALLLDAAGHVAGTTEGNVFLVRGGAAVPLVNFPEDVAGRVVRELAGDAAPERRTPAELSAADEVFLAGTACGVIALVRIDGTDIGTGTEGPVTRRIRDGFRALTRGGE